MEQSLRELRLENGSRESQYGYVYAVSGPGTYCSFHDSLTPLILSVPTAFLYKL